MTKPQKRPPKSLRRKVDKVDGVHLAGREANEARKSVNALTWGKRKKFPPRVKGSLRAGWTCPLVHLYRARRQP